MECDFVLEKAQMIDNGFSLSQIRSEILIYVLKEYAGVLNLESMVFKCMELYVEIIDTNQKKY